MSPGIRIFPLLLVYTLALLGVSTPVWAEIRGTQSTPAVPKIPVSLKIEVDLTTQRMMVVESGRPLYIWKISSGKSSQFPTPHGTFTPQWMTPIWYSRQWSWTPMPYAIFIHEGVAIHGTSDIGKLGQPASKGCIRLLPAHAKILFRLVERHGLKATRVSILGTPDFHSPRVSSVVSPSPVEIASAYPQKKSERLSTSIKSVSAVKYLSRFPQRLEISKSPQGSLSIYGGF